MIPMPRLSFDDAVRTLPAAGATAAVGSVSLVALKLWRTPHVQDAVAIVFAAVPVFAEAHAFLDSHPRGITRHRRLGRLTVYILVASS